MTTHKDPKLINIATDAARHFVDTYYPALNHERQTLEAFYHSNASIAWNGNAISGGAAFSSFFATMPKSFYDPQSFDAQPLVSDGMGSCSVMLIVSGAVKYGESNEQRGFSESFVLKPEPGSQSKFKIAAQTFRIVTA
ncbi:putative nuclear transport factor 2 [Sphaerosporella brunnea]|uniref:NTF2-related export protein n=1 Tax=Sphaerosporella brunnea TaxID=1250544 RepID=A0A5J5EWA8_9PEZI|nr:putative nuclear transport factor 2 [Sphaerosporella brunnea]